MYTGATVAILAALPAADIDLVGGLLDTLQRFFGATEAGRYFAMALGVGALYTFFSNSVTWSLGGNRAMAEAAAEREFPGFFAIEHPRLGTPVGAAVMMGTVSTAALCLYGFLARSNSDLFWSLFALSAAIFLLPYILLVLAFAKLRLSDPARPRPYRVPGGNTLAVMLAASCALLLSAALALFIYTPGQPPETGRLVGIVVFMLAGEVLIRIAETSRRAASD